MFILNLLGDTTVCTYGLIKSPNLQSAIVLILKMTKLRQEQVSTHQDNKHWTELLFNSIQVNSV